MKKTVTALLLTGISVLFMQSFATLQENTPPEIKLLEPLPGGTIDAGRQVAYKIEVRDKEDGFSGYEEIAATEVFLKSKTVSDPARAKLYMAAEKKFQAAYQQFSINGCFNCHAVRGKLAGPAFGQVRSKYQKQPGAIAMLAQKIRNGSKGVWGDSQQMPAHPAVTEADARLLVEWIFQHAADASFDYAPGLSGTFTPRPATADNNNGLIVLTAYYNDRGINGSGRRFAEQTIMLPLKK